MLIIINFNKTLHVAETEFDLTARKVCVIGIVFQNPVSLHNSYAILLI